MYLSIKPLPSSKSLTARLVQLMEKLEKSPTACNRIVSRIAAIGLGLLLVGKMAFSFLDATWYRTVRLFVTTPKDLNKQVTLSLQDAQRYAKAVKAVTGKLFWQPSLARSEMSRFKLCPSGRVPVIADIFKVHILIPVLAQSTMLLVYVASRGMLGKLFSGTPIEISFANGLTLWQKNLSLLDSLHPDRILGMARWIFHSGNPQQMALFTYMAALYVFIGVRTFELAYKRSEKKAPI